MKRVWRRHDAFLRSQRCIVGRYDCSSQIQVAHVRSAANSGMGLKPPSWDAVPLCAACHSLQHQIGQPEFERRFGVNLMEMARMFAQRSPDLEMKAEMKEHEKSQ